MPTKIVRKIPKKTSQSLVDKRREAARERNLLKRYGITIEQYNQLLHKQEGKCAMCDRHESEFKTRLAVDHNHQTGEIRGLLCNYCNRRVVGRHKDRDLVMRLYEYLGNTTGWFVPKNNSRKRKRVRKK